jgi:hypothetical protein
LRALDAVDGGEAKSTNDEMTCGEMISGSVKSSKDGSLSRSERVEYRIDGESELDDGAREAVDEHVAEMDVGVMGFKDGGRETDDDVDANATDGARDKRTDGVRDVEVSVLLRSMSTRRLSISPVSKQSNSTFPSSHTLPCSPSSNMSNSAVVSSPTSPARINTST